MDKRFERLDDALRKSEASYRTLFDSIVDGILIADLGTRMIQHANPAICRMLGYTQEEMRMLNADDLHPKEALQSIITAFKALDRGDTIPTSDLPCLKKDGTIVYANVNGVKIALDGRNCSMGIFRDITERKQLEVTLQEREEKYRRLFENGTDAVLIIDAETKRIEDVNPEALALFGYSKEEFLALSVLDISAEKDKTAANFQKIARGEVRRTPERLFLKKNGQTFYGDISAGTFMASGRKMVIGAIRDITERKRLEDKTKIISSENPNPILRIGADGTILYANAAAAPLLETWGIQIGQRAPEQLRSIVASAISSENRELLEIECHGRTFSLIVAPIRAGGYANLYGRDVTEQKQLQKQFLQAQKMESIGRLAGGVAHDFNNILTAILGYASFLLGNLESGDPRRDDAEEIRAAGERAASLTRQLLIFSRKQVTETRPIDLNAVVKSTGMMLTRLVGESIKIHPDLETKLGLINADVGQLEQVLLNLTVNARDAMPSGGKLTIRTANVEVDSSISAGNLPTRPGPYVLLSAADTGCGMAPEVMEHLFEPFFTTKEVGKGTGLGLSTIFGIVKQCGGSISVESAVGIGTTFKLLFPRIMGISPMHQQERSPVRSLKGSETILLVEDDEKVRAMARRALVEFGYTILEAKHGGEGLRIFEGHKGKIDLLLSDVVMPTMGGEELMRRIKSLRPGLKMMFLSGHTDDPSVLRVLEDKKVGFLQKPFTPQSLAQKVREILES